MSGTSVLRHRSNTSSAGSDKCRVYGTEWKGRCRRSIWFIWGYFPIILKDFVCSRLMTVSLPQTTLYTMYSVKSEKIFQVRRTSLRVSCLFSNGWIRRASEKGVVRLSIYGGSYFVSFPHIFIQTLWVHRSHGIHTHRSLRPITLFNILYGSWHHLSTIVCTIDYPSSPLRRLQLVKHVRQCWTC